MSHQKRFRSPSNPRICVPCKTGGKICKGKCKRRLPLADYSSKGKQGPSGVCKDCEYVRALNNGLIVVYAEQPLKVAYYENRIIEGRMVRVREVR